MPTRYSAEDISEAKTQAVAELNEIYTRAQAASFSGQVADMVSNTCECMMVTRARAPGPGHYTGYHKDRILYRYRYLV